MKNETLKIRQHDKVEYKGKEYYILTNFDLTKNFTIKTNFWTVGENNIASSAKKGFVFAKTLKDLKLKLTELGVKKVQ